MPPVGFEPTISAGERPQTYAFDRAATGTGALQVLGVHKQQVKGNAWETIPENKIPSILPRSVFATNFRLIIAHDCVQRHLNRTGIQGSSICPVCVDANEMERDHIKKCRSLTANMESANDRVNP